MDTQGCTSYTDADKDICFASNRNLKVPQDSGYDSYSSIGSKDLEVEQTSIHSGVEEGYEFTDNSQVKDYDSTISSTSVESGAKTSEALAKTLFSSKEEFFETYFASDQDGDSFFLIDVLNRRTEKIRKVLQLQPPLHYLNMQNEFQLTALHLAVMTHQIYLLEMLLRYGADVEIVTDRGYSILHIAAEKSDPIMLKALAVLYKSKNTLPENVVQSLTRMLHAKCFGGMSPIHIAIKKKRLENVSLLLDIGADPNDKDHLSEATPLHYAADMGDARLVTELIHNRGADQSPRARDGSTPLHVAIAYGNAAVVAILLGAGASLEEQTYEGDTARSLITDARVRKVVTNMSTPIFPVQMEVGSD